MLLAFKQVIDFKAILFYLGMGDARIADPMVSNEPRPSAKHNAMHGVEIEQISVPSKPKPGTAPKPKPGNEHTDHVKH